MPDEKDIAMNTRKTDYLVIGAGAMGMAFTDVLMTESEATVTIVDRYHQPGGHWNVAYPFVRLHQPSSAYGVCPT
jgi:cation diffusion facilitator CzcD-associated flavoprotein CzcO